MESFNFLEHLNDSLNIYIFAKDRQGRYVYANDAIALAAGLVSKEQIVGKTDYDLIWRQQADFYRYGDAQALSGKPLINTPEVQIQVTGIKSITTSKNRLVQPSTKTELIVGSYIEHTGRVLVRSGGTVDPLTKRVHLGDQFGNETLSFKEARVYFYVLLGMSATQISEEIKISKPTVQFHIENLKKKLQCTSKGGLIAIGVLSGLTHTIFEEFDALAGRLKPNKTS